MSNRPARYQEWRKGYESAVFQHGAGRFFAPHFAKSLPYKAGYEAGKLAAQQGIADMAHCSQAFTAWEQQTQPAATCQHDWQEKEPWFQFTPGVARRQVCRRCHETRTVH